MNPILILLAVLILAPLAGFPTGSWGDSLGWLVWQGSVAKAMEASLGRANEDRINALGGVLRPASPKKLP